jgi:type IV pilus assembly protein PilW
MLYSRSQQGLSLIELMIAMLIGCFLILGVTQIFIDNKRSYLFQQSQAGNQENSRFTLLLLDQELAKTGYRRMPWKAFENEFKALPAQDGCPAFRAGQTIRLSSSGKGVCIRYQPRFPKDVDCLGNGPLNKVEASPYTSADPFLEKLELNDEGELTCSRNNKAGVLVKGIADIRFELGLGPKGERKINDYSANPANDAAIRSVRYKALMISSQTRLRTDEASKVLDDWKAGAGLSKEEQETLVSNDKGQLYQITLGNITLRNLMP